jgi:diguanylate cyclase (GGDEF)-like protein
MVKQPDDNADNAIENTNRDDSEVAMGAAKVTVRVLMVTRQSAGHDAALREAAGLNEMSRWRAMLEAEGHTVAMASRSEWQSAISAIHPEVILLEVGDDVEEAAELCSEMRKTEPFHGVLTVLPSREESVASAAWSSLEASCVDDFIAVDASRTEMNNRVLLLARLAVSVRENKAARERLARHMQIDETTQLLNRRFFFQSAHREVSRARRYGHFISCLMVDIDYLDDIGKTFGYSCVEYVLRGVAYTVRQWTRDSDIVGRFSERKFVVLLPETDIEGAVAVREKMLNAISSGRFVWKDEDLPISVSIGEAERRYERPVAIGSTPLLEGTGNSTATGAASGEESPDAFSDEAESEPISVREELATLLEDADAALNVARRASLRPGIFVQYTPGSPQS